MRIVHKASPLENALAEYEKRFGHPVPVGTYNWDQQLLLERLQQALREGKPVPEFEAYKPSESVDEVPDPRYPR